jgi:hypothetical protein
MNELRPVGRNELEAVSPAELACVEGGIATVWVFDVQGGIQLPSLSPCRIDSDCWD